MNPLADRLVTKDFLLLDGGTGTQLMAQGLTSGDNPELWNVDRPQVLVDQHRAYLDAGSDIILTNTFGGSRYRLTLHDLQDRMAELNAAGAQLARRAIDEAGVDALAAGSMGQTGELMVPLGPRTPQEMTEVFAEQAAALAAGGADIIWLETMSSLDEIRAAVVGARQGAPDLPVVCTVSFDTAGRSMMGVTGTQLAEIGLELGLDGFGANCGSTLAETESALAEVVAASEGHPVVSKANAGIPVWADGGLNYNGSPDTMAAHAARMRTLGAQLIGGCCGTTPEHVAAMRAVLDGERPAPDIPAPGPVESDEDAEDAAANAERRARRSERRRDRKSGDE